MIWARWQPKEAGCAELNGRTETPGFCRPQMKHGFHEDGLSSAVDVVPGLRAKGQGALARRQRA